MAADLPIILFHYSTSPYGRKVVWYLTLRKIPYSQCIQPNVLPRPDLKALGIAYRRIPLLSIGRDVYADTRLILAKLEELYPPSESHPGISAAAISSSSTEDPSFAGNARAIERLLSHWIIDGGIFGRSALLMPPDLPQLQDPKFLADRADYVGAPTASASPLRREALEAHRPESLSEIRDAVALLETTVLADGRAWVLGTAAPTLADIEAVWPFHWLTTMPGALPADVVGPARFPRVFAWIERFGQLVAARKRELGRPVSVEGDAAAGLILGFGYAEEEGSVDGTEVYVAAEGLSKGDLVRVWPTDSGALHKDVGKLLSVDAKQIVIETQGQAGSVRLHTPRHGFRVRKAGGSANL